MIGYTPDGPMSTANWTVGLIVDGRADPAQQDALTKIFSGQAGGPLAGLMTWLSNPPDTLVRLLGAGRSVDEESADTVDSDPQGGAYLPHAFVA